MLTSVHFPDEHVGYAAGQNGTIIKTIDSGANWSNITSSYGGDVECILFLNADTGFIGGTNGALLKTTDGGMNWSACNLNLGQDIVFSIHFVTPAYGYAVTGVGKVLRTTDGGNNWSILTSVTYNYTTSVFFTDAKHGFITGGAPGGTGSLYTSTDSGATWTTTTVTNPLREICFVNSTIGYIAGLHGTILKTIDGGQNWTTKNTGTFDDNSNVTFIDANYGYLSSSGGLLRTRDGGDHWTREGTVSNTLGLYFVNRCQGYAAGVSGSVFMTDISSYINASPNIALCPGDSITLGGRLDVQSYHWNTGQATQSIVVSTAGNYSVIIVDSNGCSASSSPVSITINALPAVPVITQSGNQLISSDSTGQWYLNDTIQVGGGKYYTPTTDGSYIVKSTNSNGCTSVSAPFTFTLSDISQINTGKVFSVSPNPSKGLLQIETGNNSDGYLIEITNLQGQLILQSEQHGDKVLIDLKGQPDGFYFISARTETDIVSAKVLLMQ